MSGEKTDFTINVKVNGLEDVERLREAIERRLRPPAVPRVASRSDAFNNGDVPDEPELPTFKVGETHYRIALESVPVVQAAIRSALALTNPWAYAELDRFQRFTYRGRDYTVSTGLDANEVKPAARFKVGDTVRLKSGGLVMTVVELRPDDMVYTASRHTGEPQRHAYPAACLEVVS